MKKRKLKLWTLGVIGLSTIGLIGPSIVACGGVNANKVDDVDKINKIVNNLKESKVNGLDKTKPSDNPSQNPTIDPIDGVNFNITKSASEAKLSLSITGHIGDTSGTVTKEIVIPGFATHKSAKEKIYRGDAVTAQEMYAFVKTAKLGEVMSVPGQVGVMMPGQIWSTLNAPAKDHVPSHISAPFVDIGGWNETAQHFGDQKYGLQYANLAFIQDDQTKTYAQGLVGGNIPEDSDQMKSIISNVNEIRSRGGDAILSFGGQAGSPIWTKVNDPVSLAQYYYLLAKTGKFHAFDFDIEGMEPKKNDNLIRNSIALRIAQDTLASEGFKLSINMTLAVLPTGLTDAKKVLQVYYDSGLKINTINIMNFDYGGSFAAKSRIEYAKDAINSTEEQIKTITGVNDDTAFGVIGSTHMPELDDGGQTWTFDDTKNLIDYANDKKMSEISFWAVASVGQSGWKNKVEDWIAAFNKNMTPNDNNFFLQKTGVDIYENGKYKPKSTTPKIPNPNNLVDYVSGKTYKKGDFVKYNLNGTTYVYCAKYDSSQPPAITYESDASSWVVLGTIDWYTSYYEMTHTNPLPDKHTVNTWWNTNAWDWENGLTAQKGNVYKYNKKLYIAKQWTTKPPTDTATWELYNVSTSSPISYWKTWI